MLPPCACLVATAAFVAAAATAVVPGPGGIVSGCTAELLQDLVVQRRAEAWVCEGAHVVDLDAAPWDVWSYALGEAPQADVEFKAMTPLALEDGAEDIIWSNIKTVNRYRKSFKTGKGSARRWVENYVPPGTAILIESLHSLPKVERLQGELLSRNSLPISRIDLYASHVKKQQIVGSYGWHVKTEDALIYVIEGRKRVRVAGYFPGSDVTVDSELSVGSAVYVPGGCFYHLLSMPGEDGGGEWSKVLSLGLVNANADLLSERVEILRQNLEGRNLRWSDALSATTWSPGLERHPMTFADADAYDGLGRTALQRRALDGDIDFLKVLLETGRPQLELWTLGKDGPKYTALGLAICCAPAEKAVEAVKLLLEHGAKAEAVEAAEGQTYSGREVAGRRGLKGLIEAIASAARGGGHEL